MQQSLVPGRQTYSAPGVSALDRSRLDARARSERLATVLFEVDSIASRLATGASGRSPS